MLFFSLKLLQNYFQNLLLVLLNVTNGAKSFFWGRFGFGEQYSLAVFCKELRWGWVSCSTAARTLKELTP